MTVYVLSSDAQEDLQQIQAYYEQEAGARVARQVLHEITRGIERIASNPGIGHRRTDLTDERMRFWQVFAYLIVYDPEARPLGISRVLHGRRDLESMLRVGFR